MKKGVVAGIGTLALIAAFIMLQLTSPHQVGPLGVLAFFILAYIACASGAYLLLTYSSQLLRRTLPNGKMLLRLEGATEKRIYYYASFIALAPVIILGMQSVGSLRLTDLLLLAVFQLLGCFYISRRF